MSFQTRVMWFMGGVPRPRRLDCLGRALLLLLLGLARISSTARRCHSFPLGGGQLQLRAAPPPPKHFINLSNGVEALDPLLTAGVDISALSFVRIQSSHCEGCHYQGVMDSIDASILLPLAMGQPCIIYDYGSRGTQWPDADSGEQKGIGCPRAIWWGLEWVKYVLRRVWGMENEDPIVRGYNVKSEWDRAYCSLSKSYLKRLKYYRRWLNCREVRLYGAYAPTDNDGRTDLQQQFLLSAWPQECLSSNAVDVDVASLSDVLPPGFHLYDSRKYQSIGRAAGSRRSSSSKGDL
jgi:hypothetical protein